MSSLKKLKSQLSAPELFDRSMMLAALTHARHSNDPSTKVGAVLITQHEDFFNGFNHFPTGIAEDQRIHDRELKYRLIVHAEMNVLLAAGQRAKSGTLYISVPFCCSDCAKHVIQAGIKRIVVFDGEVPDRWQQSWALTKLLFDEAGVEVDRIG